MAVKNKKKLLSIVIKSEHIRLCELSKSNKAIRVHKAMIIPTPAGSVADGHLEDFGAIADVIKQALTVKGLNCKDVVFSIVSGRIATKEVLIPEVKENKIADIVAANASEYFPVEVNDYIIKHTILERFEEDDMKKIRLQLVAAPKTIIASYYNLASRLGLEIEDIDYAGNSIAMQINQQIGPEFCVAVNIEEDQTVVSIFENNVLKMQRTVPYGRNILTYAVTEKYGLSTEKEVKVKLYEDRVLQNVSRDDDIMYSLSYMINGIKRITDYYISRNGGRPFDKAYAMGDIVTIPGFITLLANELGNDLTPVTKLVNVNIETKGKALAKNITEFVSAIGALIDPIGLVTEPIKEEKKSGVSMGGLALLLVLSILAAAAMIVIPLINMWDYEDKADATKARIRDLGYIEDMVNDYYEAKDKYTDALAYKLVTMNNDDHLHIFLEELENKMPSDIMLSGMSVTSGSVTMSGRSASKSSIAKFVQQLNTINTVANVFVTNESEVMDNTGVISVTFTLTCTFGAIGAEEPSDESTSEAAEEG